MGYCPQGHEWVSASLFPFVVLLGQRLELGLRFAAVKLFGLRAGRVVGSLVKPNWAFVPRGADRGLGVSASTTVPLYNKQRQRGGSHSHIREQETLCSANQALPDGWARAHPRVSFRAVRRGTSA